MRPDGDLIELAKQGDQGAYDELVQRYEELAFRTAYLIVGEAAEAQDAAQEAFVKAYYALPRFRDRAPFRPWLLRIVANEARNRRLAAHRRSGLSLRLAASQPTATASSPEAAALAAERRQMLLQALNALREDDRHVIAYRYFVQLNEAEMAAVLGVPRGTVKSRLSRALARLRDRLGGATNASWEGQDG